MKIFPDRPFYVMTSNFSNSPSLIPKPMNIDVTSKTTECVMNLNLDQATKLTEDSSTMNHIASVNYMPTEDREYQIRRHATVK